MWVKIDDGFPRHPKIQGLSDAAVRAHITALCQCAEQLTDGVLSRAAVAVIAKPRVRAELVDAGVWDERDDGGIDVHDYLDCNLPRAEALELREQRREAGRLGGQAGDREKKRAAGRLGAEARWGTKQEGKPMASEGLLPDGN